VEADNLARLESWSIKNNEHINRIDHIINIDNEFEYDRIAAYVADLHSLGAWRPTTRSNQLKSMTWLEFDQSLSWVKMQGTYSFTSLERQDNSSDE